MYVCLTTAGPGPRLGYMRVRTLLVLMGPGRLGRVRPSMGPLRYIQSRNYHFCTRAPVSERRSVLRIPPRVLY